MTRAALQTEFEFTLPKGYEDDEGQLHREGTMRLATAADEIKPLKDPRVRSNESYVTVIVLARVVTRLGSLETVSPHVIENLYVSDLAYLQDLYERVNDRGADVIDATCPDCGEQFEVRHEVTGGEVVGDADGGGTSSHDGGSTATDGSGAPGAGGLVEGNPAERDPPTDE